MKAVAFVSLLVICIVTAGAYAQGVYSFADFINVDGDSLKTRYDNALAQGRRQVVELKSFSCSAGEQAAKR